MATEREPLLGHSGTVEEEEDSKLFYLLYSSDRHRGHHRALILLHPLPIRVQKALVPCRPGHLHLPLPLLARSHHSACGRPAGHPVPRRRLCRELSHRRLLVWGDVGDGERVGDAVRAGIRCWAGGHARHIHAAIVGHPQFNRTGALLCLHLRRCLPQGHRPGGPDSRGGGNLRLVHDPAALRLLHELPYLQVFAGAEQDYGDGRHCFRSLTTPLFLHLAAHAPAGLGAGGRRGGAQLVVVVHRGGAAGVYILRKLRRGLEWLFVEGISKSMGLLCLEVWYYYVLILFAGYLKNAEISVDALSICMNILGWANMVAFGANAATSVRVSNELGAGHPRTAKFSVVVAVTSSFTLGLLLSVTLLLTRHSYPKAFTNSEEVRRLVNRLTPLLAISITVNNVQPVLTGVAIGAGWQATVAYVNLACYYLFGVPLGLFLGYKMDMGVEGIWCGMLGGTLLQTFILFLMIHKTNWNSEASVAGKRLKTWRAGGKINGVDEEAIN